MIGLMSGTSLDGLDIAYCQFVYDGSWHYRIEKARTLSYSPEWRQRLSQAALLSGEDLAILDTDYGFFLGEEVKRFVAEFKLDVEAVASHGHTVFHQPLRGMSKQIGDGTALSLRCSLPVIYDFRKLDVLLGGQGAPLVPAGDELLFGKYAACVNTGGFANISYEEGQHRIAWDITGVNIVLNYLAAKLGKAYDGEGAIAAGNTVDSRLLEQLNALHYYQKKPPKSLGREWVEKEVLPLLEASRLKTEDLIATYTEHAALKISEAIAPLFGEILFTGGGTFNQYLMERIVVHSPKQRLIVPGETLINFKEALIFAFLGVLKLRGEVNTLASVTGAKRDSCGGVVIVPDTL